MVSADIIERGCVGAFAGGGICPFSRRVAIEAVLLIPPIVEALISKADEVLQVFDLGTLRWSMAILHANSEVCYRIRSGGIE